MLRRKFLSQSLKGSLMSLSSLEGKELIAWQRPHYYQLAVCDYDDRVLVIIHLHGANDVINAMVPLDQFTDYQTHRPVLFTSPKVL